MIEYQMNDYEADIQGRDNLYKKKLLQSYNVEVRNRMAQTEDVILRAAERFNNLPAATHHQAHRPKKNNRRISTQTKSNQEANLIQRQAESNIAEREQDQQQTYSYEQVLLQQKRLVRIIEDTYSILNRQQPNNWEINRIGRLQEYQEQGINRQQQFHSKKQKMDYIAYTDKQSDQPQSNRHLYQDYHSNKPPQNLFIRTCQLAKQTQKETFYNQLSHSYQNMPSTAKHLLETDTNRRIKNRIVTSSSTLPQLNYSRNWDQTQQLVQRLRKQSKERQNATKTASMIFK